MSVKRPLKMNLADVFYCPFSMECELIYRKVTRRWWGQKSKEKRNLKGLGREGERPENYTVGKLMMAMEQGGAQ